MCVSFHITKTHFVELNQLYGNESGGNMKNIFFIVLLLAFLLSGCDITNPKEMTGETIRENVKRSYDNSTDQVNRKEQVGRYNKLWNSKMLFSNTGKGIIEQRTLNGKRIAKLGKGRICAVSEQWLYFLKEKKGAAM